MHFFPRGDFYIPRQTEEALCADFPADRIYIGALERMQGFFMSRNSWVQIPILKTMNIAHAIIAYMFSNECLDQFDYDFIALDGHARDKTLSSVTLIVVAAMLKRTDNSYRASVCHDLILENRSQDFYDGVELYDRFLRSSEMMYTEADFMPAKSELEAQNQEKSEQITQLQQEIIQLQAAKAQLQTLNAQLDSELEQRIKQIEEMSKSQSQPNQVTVYNYGTYIAEQHNDIHDNEHVHIGAPTEPEKAEEAPTEEPKAEDIWGIPREGKYSEVRRYIEERKKGDPEFQQFCMTHSLRDLCKELTNIFHWYVDENSLQKNLNRNR